MALIGLLMTGNIDFSLGGSYTIDSLAIWNFLATDNSTLKNFTLIASNDASFDTYTTLGSFSATAPGDSIYSVPAETFSFTATTASYVRMEITSNFGSIAYTGFGEAAFEALRRKRARALVTGPLRRRRPRRPGGEPAPPRANRLIVSREIKSWPSVAP